MEENIKANVKANKFVEFLNRFFHFKERGSSFKGELLAGLTMFLVSVSALLVNTQIVGKLLGGTSEIFASTYAAATIVAFLGTVAVGFICNMPFIQISSLSMASVFISSVGASTGLSYQNLMAVQLVAAVVFVLLTCVPVVKKFVFSALPSSVRKALPVAVGLFIAYSAFSGVGFTDASGNFTNFETVSSDLMKLGTILTAAVIMIGFLLFKRMKSIKTPFLYSFLIGFIFYYIIGVLLFPEQLLSVDRIYIAVGADDMYGIGMGLKNLNLFKVFTEGFNFSAYTGNTFALFAGGIFTYLFMGMLDGRSTVEASSALDEGIDAGDEKKINKLLLTSAAANVAAPLLGAGPLTLGRESVAGIGDGGKTGLASVICSVGFLISLFTWAVLALLATYVEVVPEYGHAGFGIPAYVMAQFGIASAIMIVVGLNMAFSVKNWKFEGIFEFIPFAATLVGMFATGNIAYAAALGVIAYCLIKLFSFKISTIRSITLPTASMAATMTLMIVFLVI